MKNEQEVLKENYKSDFRACSMIINSLSSSEQYLGEIDAKREWANEKAEACIKFLNTNAYRKFIKNNYSTFFKKSNTKNPPDKKFIIPSYFP